MFLEKLIIFILFLGPLVFFHELGHFIFARFFGVRVEVFSIGFGPKLLKKKIGDTEYAFSAIPLGGYVKMFGDDPFNKDKVPEDEQKYSFSHKGKFARFWIVMGGPLANFILAFVLFYSLLITGERIPEVKVGKIAVESSLYKNGLRTGDVIYKVNQNEIYNPTDLMADSKTEIKTISVKRFNSEIELNVSFRGDSLFEELIKTPPIFRKPFVVDKKSNRYVVSLEKGKINLASSIEEFSEAQVATKFYIYPLKPNQDTASEKIEVMFDQETVVEGRFEGLVGFLKLLEGKGYKTLDLVVKSINMNSPADKVGIRENNIFDSLDGEKVYSFEDFRDRLQKTKNKIVKVGVYQNGELRELNVTPDESKQEDRIVKLLGVYSFIEIQELKFVHTKSKGFVKSFYYSGIRTWDSVKKTFDGFVKLVSNKVSFKSIGGPLAIAKGAHDSFKTSFSYFFQLMALISVNLGVVNLFPIPVLDGGHILFIALEIINGGPLSRRKMEIAQQVGLSILLMLMVGAIFNDFSRYL